VPRHTLRKPSKNIEVTIRRKKYRLKSQDKGKTVTRERKNNPSKYWKGVLWTRWKEKKELKRNQNKKKNKAGLRQFGGATPKVARLGGKKKGVLWGAQG